MSARRFTAGGHQALNSPLQRDRPPPGAATARKGTGPSAANRPPKRGQRPSLPSDPLTVFGGARGALQVMHGPSWRSPRTGRRSIDRERIARWARHGLNAGIAVLQNHTKRDGPRRRRGGSPGPAKTPANVAEVRFKSTQRGAGHQPCKRSPAGVQIRHRSASRCAGGNRESGWGGRGPFRPGLGHRLFRQWLHHRI